MLNVATATTVELITFLCAFVEQSREAMKSPILAEVAQELVKRIEMGYAMRKDAQRAREEFLKHYTPNDFGASEDLDDKAHILSLIKPHQLTPSYHGKECLGNGEWPGYECQCDECDFYLACFPIEEIFPSK